MAKFAPYGISGSRGKPRKLLSDWELRGMFGGGLPGGLQAEFTYDQYRNPWSAPLWQEGAFTKSPSLKDLVASEFSPRSSEILPQTRFSNLPPLGPEISVSDTTNPKGPVNSDLFTRFPDPGPVTMYGSGKQHSSLAWPENWQPPQNWDVIPGGDRETGAFTNQFSRDMDKVASSLAGEVSGEPTSTVSIDPTNMIPQLFSDVSAPADHLAAYEEYGLSPSGHKSPPGSGYLFSHPVHKGAAQMPFSELGALNREGADWQKKVGPAMTVLGGSQIPGASLLGLLAAGLNKLGAYHQFNPATDSNLFADPETGRATWGTTDPGGSGSQRGTLNLYNMLQDFGGSYPNRQVQTPRGYANAGDLAYIMAQGDRPPPGLYTQQTPVGYQDFGEGHNVTNQEALNTYNLTGAGALLNEAGAILGPDAGYNETSALAESMAEDLQGQVDYGDWGSWY